MNIHFVRDIGCGLIVGAFVLPEFSRSLFTMNTLFYILQMFVHIHEIVSERLRILFYLFEITDDQFLNDTKIPSVRERGTFVY